jgi:hypothetical protein
MRNLFTLLVIASALVGCASTLPTCDGKDRRPINVPDQAGIDYPSCSTKVQGGHDEQTT